MQHLLILECGVIYVYHEEIKKLVFKPLLSDKLWFENVCSQNTIPLMLLMKTPEGWRGWGITFRAAT